MSTRIQNFHPAWGAFPLSTAATGLALFKSAEGATDFRSYIGAGLITFAALAWLVVTGTVIARIVRFRQDFLADLRNPQLGPLLATTPAGAMLLSSAIAQLASQFLDDPLAIKPLATALVALGLFGTIVIGVSFFSAIVFHSEVPVPAITGVWFIPAVALVIAPIAFSSIGGMSNVALPMSAFIFSAASWGTGFVLFLILAPLVAYRLITQPAPPAHAIATWWIWLAPLNAGALGLIATAHVFSGMAPGSNWPEISYVIAVGMWGFGIWWLGLALTVTLRQRQEIHFGLPLWGLGFPIAALALSSFQLFEIFEFDAFNAVGLVALVSLLILWSWLAVKTAQGVVSGKVFNRA